MKTRQLIAHNLEQYDGSGADEYCIPCARRLGLRFVPEVRLVGDRWPLNHCHACGDLMIDRRPASAITWADRWPSYLAEHHDEHNTPVVGCPLCTPHA